jgi:1-acyl-sn-glycerol-3-phosphate acyltransferase
MKPKTLQRILTKILKASTRFEILGAEHVPRSGQALVVINHLGLLDLPLGYVAVDREDVTGWVADKHLKNPLFAYVVNSAGGIWLNRENPELSSMKAALASLKAGKLFAVAPEGTRSSNGAMIEGKEGIAYLAIQSGAPIIPAGITGTESVGDHWRKLRKAPLKIQFGEAFTLPKMDRKRRQAQMEEGVIEIMCRIAALIPEKYHGHYAGDPRIEELTEIG